MVNLLFQALIDTPRARPGEPAGKKKNKRKQLVEEDNSPDKITRSESKRQTRKRRSSSPGLWIDGIYHHFVQGEGNPPECQRFAFQDETCRVVDVAYL